MANEQGLEKMMLGYAFMLRSNSILFGFGLKSLVSLVCRVLLVRAWDIFTITNARVNGLRMLSVRRTQKTKINKLHSMFRSSHSHTENLHDDSCNVHDDCAQKFCFSSIRFGDVRVGAVRMSLNTNSSQLTCETILFMTFSSNRYHHFNSHSFVNLSTEKEAFYIN